MANKLESVSPDKIMAWWDTKAGTVTMAIGAVGLAGVGFILYRALPFIIRLFSNAITAFGQLVVLGVMIPILAVIAMVLTNPKTWLALTVYADRISRTITRSVMESDPIGAARTALQRMRDRLEKAIRPRQRRLLGSKKNLEQTVNDNNAQRQEELGLAAAALKRGTPEGKRQAEIHAAAAEDLAQANAELIPVLKQITVMAEALSRVVEASETKIEVFQRKIEIKAKALKAKQEGSAAAADARTLFKGADNELLAESMDIISEQISQAESDMESFINDVMPELQADELKRGVRAEQGMAKLQQWLAEQDAKPASLVESSDARALLLEAGAVPMVTQTQSATVRVSQTQTVGSNNFDPFSK